MEVFTVHEQAIADYRAFTSGFVQPRDRRIAEFVERQFVEGAQWPDPWVSLNPSFATGGSVPELVEAGLLHHECASILRRKYGQNDLGRDPVVLPQGSGPSSRIRIGWPKGERCSHELLCRQATGLSGASRLRRNPRLSDVPLSAFVRPRVLELTYNSHCLAPYAIDVLEGAPGESDPGSPFRWLPPRRDQLRAELDAAMLHLYSLSRDDAEHVLDSFFVLRKYEERDHGEFRTRRLVLAVYDAMVEAAALGSPFVSPLDPPPGSGPRHSEQPR